MKIMLRPIPPIILYSGGEFKPFFSSAPKNLNFPIGFRLVLRMQKQKLFATQRVSYNI